MFAWNGEHVSHFLSQELGRAVLASKLCARPAGPLPSQHHLLSTQHVPAGLICPPFPQQVVLIPSQGIVLHASLYMQSLQSTVWMPPQHA